MALAGPYANLHLAQTDNHASIPQLCFTGQMPLLPNQQRQSTECNYLVTHTTALLEFVRDHPGEQVPER